MHNITLITGDGIGPEVAEAARKCVDATGVQVDWDVQPAGLEVHEKSGDPLPNSVFDSIRKNRTALKAPTTTPLGSGYRSVNVRLRHELDLYVNMRPARTLPGTSGVEGVDLVVFRENSEGAYTGVEFSRGEEETRDFIGYVSEHKGFKFKDDSAFSIKSISYSGSKRIIERAFEYAVKSGRHKVTSSTKSNVMKATDGLFLKVAGEIARRYEIEHEHILADALCMLLVMKPREFDVLVMPNLYGDIVSEIAAGLTGGIGLAPGANIGDEYAVFEAIHGSAPDIAGRGIANPTALILSACLMLDHLGEHKAASDLRKAVEDVIEEGRHVTPDLKPKSKTTTDQMANAIIERI
ncbi:MAG: isocitrate/isopropylmalate dehydrogenase family protein [Candidatus Altiarchaeales archaeon]|nr:isocitrate/isopropylmalate dehydrogenase family protein [Candidatus Altiarchaeales archaeon]MBD3415967.1 isocitrate/isopropylmalate dehydrogenase family protein [Candidatus Altiarchaeales archaeon]